MPVKKYSTKSALPPFRLSKGSLQRISSRELAKLKADACAELDAQWRKDNRASARLRGRPSVKDHIVAACERIQRRMLRRKKASLEDWYEAVKENAQSHSIKLSKPPIRKFTREWLSAHLPFADLPEGLGPYCITSRKDFESVQWILIWSELLRDFPDVKRWMDDYQCKAGAAPGELPHEILPRVLQDKINLRLDFPLGPRCYDGLIRKSLRNAKTQCSAGARYPLVLRAALGNKAEK